MIGLGLLWCYCDKCGKRIEVGDDCYDIGEDTYCTDCVKHRYTLWEWERKCEAEESESDTE